VKIESAEFSEERLAMFSSFTHSKRVAKKSYASDHCSKNMQNKTGTIVPLEGENTKTLMCGTGELSNGTVLFK